MAGPIFHSVRTLSADLTRVDPIPLNVVRVWGAATYHLSSESAQSRAITAIRPRCDAPVVRRNRDEVSNATRLRVRDATKFIPLPSSAG